MFLSAHYDLTVKVYLPSYINFPHENDFTFEGEVTMSLEILEPVDKIVLNMKDILINKEKSYLVDQNNDRISVEKVVPLEKSEKVEISPTKPLDKGKYVNLTLVYTGLISKKLKGLYQTSYSDSDGTKKVAAVTHMEPTYARYLVPCFDEPEYKATWKVTVIHPKGTTAISNGMEEKEETSGDWITTRFEETPKMSSYLLTVFISEFDFISGRTKKDVMFRIWTKKEAKHMAQYALNAGIKCLDYYENLFNIPYPLKKEGNSNPIHSTKAI
ncbi:peptidase family M1 [Oesophagostomum dentatum]|uniref:Peptidase family M1 n=1 Tax=Oesophagostomum dentatum TaxID=61180 RepID=A0A0B1SF97_OESDE|nr:peptidase family M1 [Oesophagostomum dentatum]